VTTNILLVDDQVENLMALEAVLEPLGQNLVRANSGEEALLALLKDDYALILLDVQMPDLDGYQTATFIKQRDGREVNTEDAATILVRYEDGVRGALTVSQLSPGRKNSLRFEIDGARSAAAWDSERPDELWIGHRGRSSETLLRDPALLNAEGRRATWLPGGHGEGFGDTFKALYAAVYRAVAAGKPGDDYPTFADGHDAILVLEAVARSSRERRWVEVDRAVKVGN